MLTTMSLSLKLWRQLREVADEWCEGRWVALAGDGYDPCNAPPRAWAMLMAEMAGAPLPAQMPDDWLATAIGAGCEAPATAWLEDDPPVADSEQGARVAREVGEAISTTPLASPLLRG